MKSLNVKPLLVTIAIGAAIWFSPKPDALSPQAWHLLAIFIATIIGIISKPLPMGAVTILGLGVACATGTLELSQALAGFSMGPIWLIVIAFFIARAFIKTGLGTRISYYFVRMFGKSTLGLSYSLMLSELVLAPAVPSNTARNGGIIFPIVNSLSRALGSEPHSPTANHAGAFLIMTSYHCCMVLSAMFLTAMAPNPIAASLALDFGVTITWASWAKAAIVPGIISLTFIPLLIYKLAPPTLKHIPDAPAMADKKLKEMGPMSFHEKMLIGIFVFLITLWIFGGNFGINAVTTALLGLGILLLTSTLTWDDILGEKGAWNTLIWFSVLLALAKYLNEFGVIDFFSNLSAQSVMGFDWKFAFVALALVYFFSHYLFASGTAHVGAMYASFLAVSIKVGTPPLLAALLLAYFSSLFGSLTHYGAGPAPVLYGAGYVHLKKWWVVGGIVSCMNIFIWIVIGGAWWKFLGIW